MLPTRAPKSEPTAPVHWARALPYSAHVIALGFVIALITLFVGVDSVFSSDEGAALHQARFLVDYGKWGLPSTFPEVDPAGQWFPLRLSHVVDGGMAPLAKRPAYPGLLSLWYRVSPTWGPVTVSVLGAVLAAGASGLIARRIRPSLDRPTLWVAGLASPLLFDSQLIMAHTLAAAAVAVAVVAVLRFLDGDPAAWLVGALLGLTGGVLLRAEALLLALALALAAVLVTRLSGRGVLVAGTASAAVVGATMIDRLALEAIGTESGAVVPSGSGSGWLADRVAGVSVTWLDPGYLGDPLELLVVLAALLAVGVIVLMRLGASPELVLAASSGSVILVFARLAFGNVGPVPGILWAFPLLPMAVAAMSRRAGLGYARSLPLATAALFAGAVVMTQYPQGGSGEWGWRYFAIAIALVVPVALDLIIEAAAPYSAETRQRLAVVALGGGVGLALLMGTALKSVHDVNASIARSVTDEMALVTPGDGGEPVLVTTVNPIGRLAWAERPDDRWLLVDQTELGEAISAVRAAGVSRLALLVDAELLEVVEAAGGTVETDLALAGGGWRFLVVSG
ncbi:MAG: hypothetical protein GY929_17955 [Actinomycetia bacterium]|nr:hypothetical protein [Actinomycetes bacterium]